MSETIPQTQHVDNLSSLEAANIKFRLSVERKKTPLARVVLFLLYFCVVLFTFLGTMWGFPMLILTLGTLFFAWYYKGVHTIFYDYEIDEDGRGAVLTLTGPGCGLIYMEAGDPINDAALFIIEVNLP